MLDGPGCEKRTDFGGRREGTFGALIVHEFDRGHQPDTPNLADERMIGEFPKAILKPRADTADMLGDVAFLIDSDGFKRDGSADRMAGVSIPMSEGSELLTFAN